MRAWYKDVIPLSASVMKSLQYYTSEKFIWDSLIEQSEKGLAALYNRWKEHKKINDFAIFWPSEPVKAEDGSVVKAPVALMFENNKKADRRSAMLETIGLTKAYALLLVEQQANEIKVILESRHGTKSWTIPITQSGDIKILGTQRVATDIDAVGLLWRPKMTSN